VALLAAAICAPIPGGTSHVLVNDLRWRPRLEARIETLERLRDRLDGCIGCGCVSLRACTLLNPADEAARRGPGPRHILDPD
jgi:hypothetical protein